MLDLCIISKRHKSHPHKSHPLGSAGQEWELEGSTLVYNRTNRSFRRIAKLQKLFPLLWSSVSQQHEQLDAMQKENAAINKLVFPPLLNWLIFTPCLLQCSRAELLNKSCPQCCWA